jgi:lipid A 3-O-deacylase
MKKLLCVFAIALFTSQAFAQSAVTHPGWNYGLFAGFGNGISQDSDFHRFTFGGRLGRVLTSEHGPGFLRGTLEWNAEVTPVEIFNYHETVYTAGITPLVAKWNFTSAHKTVPYFEAIGGVLFSSSNFPAGDTSHINFQSGAGLGFNHFVKPNRAINFEVRAFHISNASLGNHNPGINAQLQFQVGYTWFK